MRVLVDCIPLNVGGGIQVSISFLLGLRARADIAWRAVVPVGMKQAMPAVLAMDPRLLFLRKRSAFDRVWLSRKLQVIESEFAPDVVFTVFGPAVFRTRAPHLVGFALPHLIYEADCDALIRRGIDRLSDWLRCVALRRSDHLVVETQTVRRRLADRLGIDPARISVIPNSVNPIIAEHSKDESGQDGRFAFLIPSAHYPHKNLEIVPRVAAAIARLAPDLDFEFRFTLEPQSTAWRLLASKAEQLGVANRLVTLNVLRLDELAHAYRAASAVFLPTLREASTAVYPESFAMRRPLVTSDLDFAHELCGEAALFVPPLDAAAIAKNLVELARSPQLQRRLVETGKKQLSTSYPGPAEKFAMQLELLGAISRDRRYSFRPAAPHHEPPRLYDRGAEKCPAEKSRATRDNPIKTLHDAVASHWDVRYRSGGFLRRANFFKREILPFIAGQGHWLDAGCGSGYFARLLASRGVQVTGVDASAPMIEAANKLASQADISGLLNFMVIRDVVRLPFADDSFAGCLCLSVLEYVDEPYESLNELARVIKPGGVLVLSVPCHYSAVRLFQQILLRIPLNRVVRKLQYKDLSKYSSTIGELRDALLRRGFAVMKIASFDPLVPPTLLPSFAASLMFAVAVKTA